MNAPRAPRRARAFDSESAGRRGSASRSKLLSEQGFGMLRMAVGVARNEQIRSVPALRARLGSLCPGEGRAISEALSAWSEHVQAARG